MKVLSVVGARPNFMKIAPLHRILQRRSVFDSLILHTGQHYDENMSDVFFRQLGLPEPDLYLGIGSGSHAEQTARIMMAFDHVLDEVDPDVVIVVGDVNSTVACGLTTAKRGIPLVHVEAGLRSFDRRMPEEINRLVTDQLSDLLFVTEPSGVENLRREGISTDKVFLVGNVMIDTLVAFREKAQESEVLERLGVQAGAYLLSTVHRPSNVDNVGSLRQVAELLTALTNIAPVVFPVHPRTRQRLEEAGLMSGLEGERNLILVEPLGYLDFLKLMDHALLVMTDSGGIQEETTFLRVPCITLRDSTERPITLECGGNRLMPLQVDAIMSHARAVVRDEFRKSIERPLLWDGHAAERIVDVLEAQLK